MKKRILNKSITKLLVSFNIASLLLTTGCGRPRGILFTPLEEPLVWPKPPETPRIAYVGMISTEGDLKPAVSWSQGLTELFFGKEDIGILVSPTAVACDDEKIYVTDSAAAVVHIFDLQTRQYRQVTTLGTGDTLMMPVAVTLMEDLFCITDSILQKVCVFEKNGDFKFAFGQHVLSRPTGIAFSPSQQKLYVTDTIKHKVNVFDRQGNFLFDFGSRGIEPGRFNYPTYLWTDNNQRVYVSDTLNYRIQVFSFDGKFIRMFGIHGDRPGNFAHPSGIATDSQGHIYVVDKQYENVQIFDNEGRILMAFGTEGNGPGEFWLPVGIFIRENDWIYIADSFNKRIQVFEFLETQVHDED